MLIRCRRCPPCRSWRKAKRISCLTDATSGWDAVFTLTTGSPREFTALTTRLRRHNTGRRTADNHDPVQYVSVPIDDGRVVLTNDSTVGGTLVHPTGVAAEITRLVGRMAEGRISCSVAAKRKPKKTNELGRVRRGVIKLSAAKLSALCQQHGAPTAPVKEAFNRGGTQRQLWDISSLGPDARLALFMAIGIRVTGGQR